MKTPLSLLFIVTAFLLAPVHAQTQPRQDMVLVATLAYEEPQVGIIGVHIVYRGSQFAGDAWAKYVYPDGRVVQDDMFDCALTDANGVWSIDCRNPHYITWDRIYRHTYAVSSELITGGRLVHRRLVGPVSVVARYAAPAPR